MYDLADSLSSDARFVDFAIRGMSGGSRSWSAWSPDIVDEPSASSMATDALASSKQAIVSGLRALGSVLSEDGAVVSGWHVKWESDAWLVSLLVSEHVDEAYEAAYRAQQSLGSMGLSGAEVRVVALQGRPIHDVSALLDDHSAS